MSKMPDKRATRAPNGYESYACFNIVLLVVMRVLRFRLRHAALQELFLLLFFRAVFRSLWIVPLHLQPFFRRQLRQMPDESHQLPTVFAASVFVRCTKRRHSRKAHSIFDDPENLAVAKLLGVRAAQIRRFRIES